MAHANIYIRKENEELWDQIEDKSAFVNALISKEEAGEKVGHENVGRLQDEIVERKTGLDKVRKDVAKIKPLVQADKIDPAKEEMRKRWGM